MTGASGPKPATYYENARPEMVAYVPAEARTILEIGCGEGRFGERLKQDGDREVWGIEVVPRSGAEAAGRLDHVIVGDVAAVLDQVPDRLFDVAVCNDVLEHLVDPEAVLKSLKSKLARGGVVVSSIPNIRYYPVISDLVLHKRFEYEESGILDSTHLRFFTVASIRTMYERLGYEVLRHEGINPIPVRPRRLRLAQRLFGDRFADMEFAQFATVARPRPEQ